MYIVYPKGDILRPTHGEWGRRFAVATAGAAVLTTLWQEHLQSTIPQPAITLAACCVRPAGPRLGQETDSSYAYSYLRGRQLHGKKQECKDSQNAFLSDATQELALPCYNEAALSHTEYLPGTTRYGLGASAQHLSRHSCTHRHQS